MNDHIFIQARMGSTEKDLLRAKELIKVAASAGADAVKFQTYRPDTVYVENAGQSEYLSKHGENENIYDIFGKFSMPYEMLKNLSDECNKENIILISTPFSVADATEVDKYVSIHKVASYELNHIRLLEFLSTTKKPIILSTGASNYEEIDFALNLLKKNGANDLCLLQCTAKYPAPLESLNLAVIPELKKKYNLPVGFSDHSLDPIIAPLLSIGHGATIIEKHFTIDKNLEGPDHKFALNPKELELMIKSIRKSEKAKGDGIKRILEIENELRNFAVRSVQAIHDISKGEIFEEKVNVDILRSGNQIRGADPRFLSQILGKKSNKEIKSGQGVKFEDCSK